jgi:hypothetical protein
MKAQVNVCYAIMSIGLLCLLTNCQKESIPEFSNKGDNIVFNKPEGTSPFVVKEGIIFFNSLESFGTTMENLHKMDPSELSDWVKGLEGFTSMQGVKSKSLPAWEVIPDRVFACVINSKGLYAIGDSISLIDGNNEYIISINNYDPRKDETYFHAVGVKHKVTYSPIGNSLLKFTGWITDTKNYYPGENRWCTIEGWNTSYWAYASYGTKLSNYMGSNNEDFIHTAIMGSSSAKQSTQGTYVYSYFSTNHVYNDNVNQIVIGWLAGIGVRFDVEFIISSNYLKDNCGGVEMEWSWAERFE